MTNGVELDSIEPIEIVQTGSGYKMPEKLIGEMRWDALRLSFDHDEFIGNSG